MADDDLIFTPRFLACRTLREANIPCVVWCEDAIQTYGCDIIAFKLYVLVPNIDEAAEVLIQKGWSRGREDAERKFGNASLNSAHRYLIPPIESTKSFKLRPRLNWTPPVGPPSPPYTGPAPPGKTVLLPAAEWNFILPQINQHPGDGSQPSIFPPLPELLDSLIDKLLDDPLDNSGFWLHVCYMMCSLYAHAPVLKEKSFAEKLKYDHGQFHFDILAGMMTGIPFIHHERPIREALRKGTWQLRDCSAEDRNDKLLFDDRSKVLAEEYEKAKQDAWAAELAAELAEQGSELDGID